MGIVASGQTEPVTTFAFDAKSNATTDNAARASPISWTHTPVGIPKGVLVLIAVENEATDPVTAVTYGGVALSHVSGSPLADTVNAEVCHAGGWFLGSGLPTGAQTVVVTFSTIGGSINAVACTVVGPNNSAIEDTSTISGAVSGADPSLALTITADSFCAGLLISGRAAAADVTPGAAMTQLLEIDVGAELMSWVRKTDLATTNTSVDWTAASEEYAILAVAIKST
jgi:hypothetical protein